MVWCSRGVGTWVATYRKEHGSAEERRAAGQAAEVVRLKKGLREPGRGCEFLKEERRPGLRGSQGESEVCAHRSRGRQLPDLLNECCWSKVSRSGCMLLEGST